MPSIRKFDPKNLSNEDKKEFKKLGEEIRKLNEEEKNSLKRVGDEKKAQKFVKDMSNPLDPTSMLKVLHTVG